MNKCLFCGSPLIWDGHEDADVLFGEDYIGRIWLNYHCPECGAEYQVVTPATWCDCTPLKKEE